ncbi:MAG: hypothetical protein ABIE84_01775 [bacterium]
MISSILPQYGAPPVERGPIRKQVITSMIIGHIKTYMKRRDMPRQPLMRQIIALARRLNPDFDFNLSTNPSEKQLRKLVRQLNMEVLIPQGRIVIIHFKGQATFSHYRICQETWTILPYLGGIIRNAEVELVEGDQLARRGFCYRQWGFTITEKHDQGLRGDYSDLLSGEREENPLEHALHSLLREQPGSIRQLVKQMNHDGTFHHERQHAKDWLFWEQVNQPMYLRPVQERYETTPPDSNNMMRDCEQFCALMDREDYFEEFHRDICELSAYLGGTVDQIKHYFAAKKYDLALITALKFITEGISLLPEQESDVRRMGDPELARFQTAKMLQKSFALKYSAEPLKELSQAVGDCLCLPANFSKQANIRKSAEQAMLLLEQIHWELFFTDEERSSFLPPSRRPKSK